MLSFFFLLFLCYLSWFSLVFPLSVSSFCRFFLLSFSLLYLVFVLVSSRYLSLLLLSFPSLCRLSILFFLLSFPLSVFFSSHYLSLALVIFPISVCSFCSISLLAFSLSWFSPHSCLPSALIFSCYLPPPCFFLSHFSPSSLSVTSLHSHLVFFTVWMRFPSGPRHSPSFVYCTAFHFVYSLFLFAILLLFCFSYVLLCVCVFSSFCLSISLFTSFLFSLSPSLSISISILSFFHYLSSSPKARVRVMCPRNLLVEWPSPNAGVKKEESCERCKSFPGWPRGFCEGPDPSPESHTVWRGIWRGERLSHGQCDANPALCLDVEGGNPARRTHFLGHSFARRDPLRDSRLRG